MRLLIGFLKSMKYAVFLFQVTIKPPFPSQFTLNSTSFPPFLMPSSPSQPTRYSRFMSSFEHISGKINSIYGQLTRSVTHPLGGTAYLALENEDEPFQGGIRYTAMPPTKRFRDMEQLSGGERTVAALALLFAVHRLFPFVLGDFEGSRGVLQGVWGGFGITGF